MNKKSVIILAHLGSHQKQVTITGILVEDQCKNIGLWLGEHLNMDIHITVATFALL